MGKRKKEEITQGDGSVKKVKAESSSAMDDGHRGLYKTWCKRVNKATEHISSLSVNDKTQKLHSSSEKSNEVEEQVDQIMELLKKDMELKKLAEEFTSIYKPADKSVDPEVSRLSSGYGYPQNELKGQDQSMTVRPWRDLKKV